MSKNQRWNVQSRLLMASCAIACLAGCASVTPNQGLVDAQGRLSSDYNDKLIAERGQGDLANAKTALGLSATEWDQGKQEVSNHHLTMATTYLELAETRGRQAGVEQETARLNGEAQKARDNQLIAGKDVQIASRDQVVETQTQEIARQDQRLASKDAELKRAQDALQQSDMKITNLGSTMVLQDVSFETGQSTLLAGGVNRLQPLINYLKLSPMTRVRIEGFTDSVGGDAYNQRLSQDRANSVMAILTAAAIDPSRIDAVGAGLTKPVASNATVSGRQSNRRVEITLLKTPGV